MFKQVLIAAAMTVTMSGGVAFAKEPAPAADADNAAAPASDKTRYCIQSKTVTGSILPIKKCKTLAEWKELGVDPSKTRR